MNTATIVIALGLFASFACDPTNTVPPETEATQFANTLGMRLKGVSCAGTDSDNDGYVTCTVNVDDGDGRTHLESLQCASNPSYKANGCKGTIAKAQPAPQTTVYR